jgi:signal recognition particle subunit SRP54
MMCGLQGSGKTTTAGKLAKLLKDKQNKKVLLVAGDVYRPAAIDQLETIAKQVNVDILNMGDKVSPVEIARKGVEKARNENYDVVIIDTAGRLQIDEKLMQELVDIENAVKPDEELLLVDAMSGQDAVNVANAFNEKLHLTGMVMSKLDGDARGGAALSIKHLTGIPIKYAGMGEKLTDLEIFHPDRMADRILGMGDIVTLVEKVQEEIDEKEAKKTANKMMQGKFDLDDMLKQIEQYNKLQGSALLKLIPGMPKITDEQKEQANKMMKATKAIIQSMTPEERKNPDIIKNSRKVRIAAGCGKTNADVNKVLKQYDQMKVMMKQMKNYGGGFPGGKFPKF